MHDGAVRSACIDQVFAGIFIRSPDSARAGVKEQRARAVVLHLDAGAGQDLEAGSVDRVNLLVGEHAERRTEGRTCDLFGHRQISYWKNLIWQPGSSRRSSHDRAPA